jgi:subtilisin family serine protease
MKTATRFAVPLLFLLIPIIVAAQTTDVDWDHSTDFSRLRTFTWATGAYPIQDPQPSLGMARAVQEELQAKGVQFVGPQQKFDAFVTYDAQVNPDPQDSSRQTITVTVRILDAPNNTVVWRAGGYVALVDDKQQNRSNVRALLATMFQQYLPLTVLSSSSAPAQGGPRRVRGPEPVGFQRPKGESAFASDHLLVRFRPGKTAVAQTLAHGAVGARVQRQYQTVPSLQLVQLPAGVSVARALQAYRRNPNVQYAEPDFIVRALETVPNDPAFPQLWAMKNTGQAVDGGSAGTPEADIKATLAWDLSTGSRNVVVAVIDTGVDYNHSDLSANIWSASSAFLAGGINCPAGSHGFNALAKTCNPMDDNGHGTHVSGTIGAVGSNGVGVVGVNWQVSILACKFLDSSGRGYISDAVACLDMLAALKDQGVNIVATNNSWGGYNFSQALYDAIAAQRERGILYVAAAGNDGWDLDSGDILLNRLDDLVNVIAVAATDNRDALASFSDFGRHIVHLGAPGVDIYSTLPGDTYGFLQGTSMATPHVTGSVALLQAQNPGLDWRAIRNLILAGGDPLSSVTNTISQRRLNVFGAMTCSPGPSRTLQERLHPVLTPATATVGKPTTFAVLSINCGAPAGPVTITVEPGGQSVPLLDDGNLPDQVAGDGIFAGSWTPASPGYYTATFPNDDVLSLRVLQSYSFEAAPFSYVNFTGTNLNFNDTGSIQYGIINLPFPIRVGGMSVHTLYVHGPDGTIRLEPSGVFWPEAMPVAAAGTIVAPFWDWLGPIPGSSQNVFWTTLGSAPNRQVVIEWRNVPRFTWWIRPPSEAITFQVVFNESKDDVLFNYLDVVFGDPDYLEPDFGGLAAVGIQTSSDSATQFAYDQPSLTDNMTLLWRAAGPGFFTSYCGPAKWICGHKGCHWTAPPCTRPLPVVE